MWWRSVGRRRGQRWLSGACAVASLAASLSGCGGAGPAAAPRPLRGSLSWHPCTAGQGPTGLQCASLTVPLDTALAIGSPGAATVTLALDRLPATGTPTGSLVFDPGGPGVSAVDGLPGFAGLVAQGVRAHLDLVAVDPPGVGHSTAVQCLDDRGLGAYVHTDPSPPGPDGFARVEATARAFAAACEARSGPLLAHVSTLDAARDLDRVRAALGDASLTYVGFSYGTLLGATYASRYPGRVRAMVLDGPLDPTLDPLEQYRVQSAAVDAQFRAFAANCAAARGCPWKAGPDPTATLLALVARSRATPIPAGAGRTAGPSELLYGTAEALYLTSLWPVLDQALADAGAGRGQRIVALFDRYVGRSADGTYQRTVESETAVNCADTTAPSLEAVQAASASAATSAPLFGPLDVNGEATCAVWPVPATGGPHSLTAPGAPPILVVGSTGDPVTPYPWAVHLAQQLASGVLLTRVGDGHTAYPASACIRRAVDAYLVTARPPAPGTRCPSP